MTAPKLVNVIPVPPGRYEAEYGNPDGHRCGSAGIIALLHYADGTVKAGVLCQGEVIPADEMTKGGKPFRATRAADPKPIPVDALLRTADYDSVTVSAYVHNPD